MKHLIFATCTLLSTLAYGQSAFVMSKNGLEPPLMELPIDGATPENLYARTLSWIETNKEQFKLEVGITSENELIQFSAVRWNAVHVDERYYIVKYLIGVRLAAGSYEFRPLAIEQKVNSKYDMGWEEVVLTDGDRYFKKGKTIRKYKSYLADLPAPLNEICRQLQTYLNGD